MVTNDFQNKSVFKFVIKRCAKKPKEEKDLEITSCPYVGRLHSTLDHMARWKLFGHVTASIRILTLTSLRTHGYFWTSSVNKLTALPAFVNSSWWCLWCSLHMQQLGKWLWFEAEEPGCRLRCSASSTHTSSADFMVTFKATMSPFPLSPLGSNESFH